MIEKYFYYYERKYRITEDGELFRCAYEDTRIQEYNGIRNVLHRHNKEIKLKFYIDDDGYANCNLISCNKSRHYKVHHLVYMIFIQQLENINDTDIGYSNNYIQINHIDGNKLNNNYKNLELVTLQENIQHAVKLGIHNSQIKAKYIEIYRYDIYITTIWKTREVSKYIEQNYNVTIDKGTISRRARDGKEVKGFKFKYKV